MRLSLGHGETAILQHKLLCCFSRYSGVAAGIPVGATLFSSNG